MASVFFSLEEEELNIEKVIKYEKGKGEGSDLINKLNLKNVQDKTNNVEEGTHEPTEPKDEDARPTSLGEDDTKGDKPDPAVPESVSDGTSSDVDDMNTDIKLEQGEENENNENDPTEKPDENEEKKTAGDDAESDIQEQKDSQLNHKEVEEGTDIPTTKESVSKESYDALRNGYLSIRGKIKSRLSSFGLEEEAVNKIPFKQIKLPVIESIDKLISSLNRERTNILARTSNIRKNLTVGDKSLITEYDKLSQEFKGFPEKIKPLKLITDTTLLEKITINDTPDISQYLYSYNSLQEVSDKVYDELKIHYDCLLIEIDIMLKRQTSNFVISDTFKDQSFFKESKSDMEGLIALDVNISLPKNLTIRVQYPEVLTLENLEDDKLFKLSGVGQVIKGRPNIVREADPIPADKINFYIMEGKDMLDKIVKTNQKVESIISNITTIMESLTKIKTTLLENSNNDLDYINKSNFVTVMFKIYFLDSIHLSLLYMINDELVRYTGILKTYIEQSVQSYI